MGISMKKVLHSLFFDQVLVTSAPQKASHEVGVYPPKKRIMPIKRTRPLPKAPLAGSVESISIDHGLFPTLRLTEKPHHREYQAVLEEFRDQAFDAIFPYYKYLTNMKGIRENADMQRVTHDVICRYIVHFWDVPSSQSHHHAIPWGGLIHSLETACIEAEIALASKIFAKEGYGVDSERTRKDALWQVFGGFLVGILHDVSKIHDVRIFSAGQSSKEFLPMKGNLLDFYLTHPEGVIIDWKPKDERENNCVFYNMGYAWTFVPPEVYKDMPHDIMIYTMKRLQSFGGLQSDQKSVAIWAKQGDFYNKVLHEVGVWYMQKPGDFRQGEDNFIHKLDTNWYVCGSKEFMFKIGQALGHEPRSFHTAMVQAGIVASPEESNNHYLQLGLNLNGSLKQRHVCFVRAEIFDDAIARTTPPGDKKRTISRAQGICIDFKSKQAVLDHFKGVEPSLAGYVFSTSGEEDDEQKKKKPAPTAKEKKKPAKKKAPKKPKKNFPTQQEVLDDVVDDAMPPVNILVEPTKEKGEEIQPPEESTSPPDSEDAKMEQGSLSSEVEVKEDIEPQLEESPSEEDVSEKEDNVELEDSVELEEVAEPEVAFEKAENDEPEGSSSEIEEDVEAVVEDLTAVQEEDPAVTVENKEEGDKKSNEPFYMNHSSVSHEEAHDLFLSFLKDTASKERAFQGKKKGLIFLSNTSEVFFHYPICVNQMLGIPKGELSDETKVLRSKMLKSLVELGYYEDEGDEAFKVRRFDVVKYQGSELSAFQISGRYNKVCHENIFDLNKAFGERLQDMFADKNHAEELKRSEDVDE